MLVPPPVLTMTTGFIKLSRHLQQKSLKKVSAECLTPRKQQIYINTVGSIGFELEGSRSPSHTSPVAFTLKKSPNQDDLFESRIVRHTHD